MSRSAASSEVVRAAGGVVWRKGADGIELVLVHRPAYDDWSFPKGKLHDGESELDAAVREVAEETGIRCAVGRDLGTVSYTDGRGRPKTVRYWAMTAPDGRALAPTGEVDGACWVPVDDVRSMLTYDHDRGLLGRFGEVA